MRTDSESLLKRVMILVPEITGVLGPGLALGNESGRPGQRAVFENA
jgi:hypothetical protein